MPIRQESDEWPLMAYHHNEEAPAAFEAVIMRKMSEESIRTEDCEGPVPDMPVEDEDAMAEPENDIEDNGEGEILCSDRAELIERIKRGESPTWVPNKAVSGIWIGQIRFEKR